MGQASCPVPPGMPFCIGVGGAGCNALSRSRLEHAFVFEADASRTNVGKHASLTKSEVSICSSPSVEIVARSAPRSVADLAAEMKGRPAVFILAGLGGMTGSYVSPIVSHLVRKSSRFVVAIVCSPFSVEGQGRRQHCMEGLKRLRQQADLTIVFDNDVLAREVPNLPLRRAFSLMDEFMNALPNDAGMVAADKWVEEAKKISSSSTTCAAALGLGAGSEASERAVRDALRSPWLQGGANSYRRGLMVISGPSEAKQIALDTAATEAPDLKLTALLRPGDYGECRASILLGK